MWLSEKCYRIDEFELTAKVLYSAVRKIQEEQDRNLAHARYKRLKSWLSENLVDAGGLDNLEDLTYDSLNEVLDDMYEISYGSWAIYVDNWDDLVTGAMIEYWNTSTYLDLTAALWEYTDFIGVEDHGGFRVAKSPHWEWRKKIDDDLADAGDPANDHLVKTYLFPKEWVREIIESIEEDEQIQIQEWENLYGILFRERTVQTL